MTTWGYELLMPGRPTKAQQREVMRAFGIDMSERGTLWSDILDRAKRHRTAGQTQLTGRNDLILAVSRGDTVVVADQTCLGVSGKDAAWFLGLMASKDVTVVINGELHRIEPGAGVSALAVSIDRAINNYQSARTRGRV